jgi:F0F1-type ATP synthase membrane subunit a
LRKKYSKSTVGRYCKNCNDTIYFMKLNFNSFEYNLDSTIWYSHTDKLLKKNIYKGVFESKCTGMWGFFKAHFSKVFELIDYIFSSFLGSSCNCVSLDSLYNIFFYVIFIFKITFLNLGFFFFYKLFKVYKKTNFSIYNKRLDFRFNEKEFIFKQITFFLYSKLKEFINVDTYTQFNWYFNIYVLMSFYSIYSLFPKINSIITIFAIPTYCAFWIFFTQNIMGLIVNKENVLCIFYPGKLIYLIAPLLIILEQLSYFVKPFSLSVRIFANMLAGHILVHIISTYASFFFLKNESFFLW